MSNVVNLIFGGSGGGGSGDVTFSELTGCSGHLQDQIDSFGSTGVAVTLAQLQTTSGTLKSGFYYLNVKDYGALGDGSTDDSSALNSCFTAAWTSGRGVFVPNGTYVANSLLKINAGLAIYGERLDNAIITCSNTTGDLFRISSGGFVTFNNLVLNTSVTKTQGAFIHQTGSAGLVEIDNCRLIGGFNSVILRSATTSRFTRSRFQNFSDYGIQILSGSSVNSRIAITNCGITNGTNDKTGIRIEALNYGIFDQNSVALPGSNGVYISAANGANVTGVYIGDNYDEAVVNKYRLNNVSGGFFFPIYSGDVTSQLSSYATFAQLTGASGVLHAYTDTMSGIISGWVTGWVATHAGTGGGGGTGSVANVDGTNFHLLYGDASTSVDWANQTIFDEAGQLSISWGVLGPNNRLLFDSAAQFSLDWDQHQLYGDWSLPAGQPNLANLNSIATVGWTSGASGWLQGQIDGIVGVSVADVSGGKLFYQGSTGTSINWYSGIIFDENEVRSISWNNLDGNNRRLFNTSEDIVLDWESRLLHQGWNIDSTDGGNLTAIANVDYVKNYVANSGGGGGGGGGGADGTMFRQNMLISGVNTTALASIFTGFTGEASGVGSQIIPASYWEPGKSVKIKARLSWGTVVSAAPVHQFDLFLNGTLITDLQVNDVPDNVEISGDTPGWIDYETNITCIETGVSGSIYVDGKYYRRAGLTTFGWWNALSAVHNPVAIDLSTPLTVDLLFGMNSSPDPANQMILMEAIMFQDGIIGASGAGALNPIDIPTGTSIYDDEFNGSTLDPKWTYYDPDSSVDRRVTVAGGKVYIEQDDNAVKFVSIYQDAPPSGEDFIITASLGVDGELDDFGGAVVFIGDSGVASGLSEASNNFTWSNGIFHAGKPIGYALRNTVSLDFSEEFLGRGYFDPTVYVKIAYRFSDNTIMLYRSNRGDVFGPPLHSGTADGIVGAPLFMGMRIIGGFDANKRWYLDWFRVEHGTGIVP